MYLKSFTQNTPVILGCLKTQRKGKKKTKTIFYTHMKAH